MQRSLACFVVAAVLAAGCSDVGANEGKKGGDLGNGDFTFACDDSVPCGKFETGRAAEFPNVVARGSTFRVGFVPTSGSGSGLTVGAVGESFLSPNQLGLLAVHEGLGTIVARNPSGEIVDFTNIRIEVPDSIAIYDDGDASPSPTTVTSVSLEVGKGRSVRALARKGGTILAGRLAYEWASDSASILQVDTVEGIKATLVGRAAGATTITVTGGTFQQKITVAVR